LQRYAARMGRRWFNLSTDYVFDGATASLTARRMQSTRSMSTGAARRPASAPCGRRRLATSSCGPPGCTGIRSKFRENHAAARGRAARLAGRRGPARLSHRRERYRRGADRDRRANRAAARWNGGTFHFAAAGNTSWHGFAEEIAGLARTFGAWPKGSGPRVEPITTDQYPTAAQRPMNSVLDCRKIAALGISPPPWRSSLPAVVRELVGGESR